MKIFLIDKVIKKKLIGLEKSAFYKFITVGKSDGFVTTSIVEEIIEAVKKDGDKALISYCNKFDKTSFSKAGDFLLPKKEFDKAEKELNQEVRDALKLAYSRIKSYHQKQLPQDFYFIDDIGVELGNSWRTIESVGVYVPGGTASYPSSVLMSVVPAIVAGVKEISICVPSSAGKINPAVIFAAKICGVKKIYKIGGAQAIAALAYGTKTVKKVDKIVGPGNSYVACAKKILFGEVGIDMIAGPTDVTIIADESSNPRWIAADALSQLEHGIDSKAFIITDSEGFAKKVLVAIEELKMNLPRLDIIEKSLKNSAIFVIKNLDEAVHIVNVIAPEHLEIVTKNPKKFLPNIKNAGAIFLGKYTPEAIGDYIAGPSHTLPTSSSARFSSGLSVFDFLKRVSIISCDRNSFLKLSNTVSILANCEGLCGHDASISIRTSDQKYKK